MTASDWDPEALLFVLRIIHGRTVELPRHIGREMLARVAAVVDYYGCAEAVSPFVEMWMGLEGDALKSIDFDDWTRETDNEIAFVIFVSLVFGIKHEFSRATTLVMERRIEPVPTHDVPIPRILIGRPPPYTPCWLY